MAEWDQLSPKDRAFIGMEGFKVLVKLRPLPPGTQEESVKNAEEAFQLMQAVEKKFVTRNVDA